MQDLRKTIPNHDYVYGCLISPDVLMLSGSVFTWLEMHCIAPTEWGYYTASLKKIYKSVLPL